MIFFTIPIALSFLIGYNLPRGDYMERIKTARKLARMTQEDLAAAIGVKRSVISKYESGAINPSFSQISKIAAALHTTTLYLTGEIDDPSPELDLEKIALRAVELKKAALQDRAKQMLLSHERWASIPPELSDEIDVAESDLIETVRRICGMDYTKITECIANGDFDKVFCPGKIEIVRQFIEDNEKTLKVIFDTDKGDK